MFRSPLTYKVGNVNTFLGECLIKFKVLLYSWGWHHTRLQGMCQGTCREMPALSMHIYLRVICNCGVWQPNLLRRTSEIAVHCTNSHKSSFVWTCFVLNNVLILNFSGNKMLCFRHSSQFCAVCVVFPGTNRCFLLISAWQRWRSWNSSSIQLNSPNWQVTIIALIFYH